MLFAVVDSSGDGPAVVEGNDGVGVVESSADGPVKVVLSLSLGSGVVVVSLVVTVVAVVDDEAVVGGRVTTSAPHLTSNSPVARYEQ